MTSITQLDETTPRPVRRMRRTVALTAIAAFGLLTPTAAHALPGETPPAPEGPGGFTAEEPDDCPGPAASCDITHPEEPEDCPPPAASCDITTPTTDPDGPDPENPGEPGDLEPSGNPSASVAVPILATPTFTG